MLKGRRVPQFLQTHPLSEVGHTCNVADCLGDADKRPADEKSVSWRVLRKARVKAIEKNLPKAEQEYELSGCNTPRGFFSGFQ